MANERFLFHFCGHEGKALCYASVVFRWSLLIWVIIFLFSFLSSTASFVLWSLEKWGPSIIFLTWGQQFFFYYKNTPSYLTVRPKKASLYNPYTLLDRDVKAPIISCFVATGRHCSIQSRLANLLTHLKIGSWLRSSRMWLINGFATTRILDCYISFHVYTIYM